jgi:hypothetical protein
MSVDWNALELTALTARLRRGKSQIEAERLVVAFEHAVELARADESFLDDLLVAVVCLLAHAEGATPRDVLEAYFRRTMPDARWRAELEPLLNVSAREGLSPNGD